MFATGGLDGPIALAAPGLLAIVVGLVLAHLTTPTAALLGRRQLRRGRVRVGVSLLDAARSPATRRIVAIVTLASALAVFSADALIVGQRNRATAAEQEAGAAMVLTIRGNELADLRAALDEVDPEGPRSRRSSGWCLPGKDAPGTLAVVRVVLPRHRALPRRRAARAAVGPPAAAGRRPIDLTGTELGIDVDDSTLARERVDGKTHPVTLGLDLVDRTGETLHTTLGTLASQTGPPCASRTESAAPRRATSPVCGPAPCPARASTGRVTLRNLTAEPSGEVVPLGPAEQWAAYAVPTSGRITPSSTLARRAHGHVRRQGRPPMTCSSAGCRRRCPRWCPGRCRRAASATGSRSPGSTARRRPPPRRHPGPGAGVAARHLVVDLDSVERGRAVLGPRRIELWFADDDPALLARVTEALDEHGIAASGTHDARRHPRTYDESAAAWSLQLAALVGGRRAADRAAGAGGERGQRVAVAAPATSRRCG